MNISVSSNNIRKLVEDICCRSPRYAGTKGEAETRDYIVSEAKRQGLKVELEEFDYLHYQPKSSTLEIVSPIREKLDNIPLNYAGNGTAEGEAVYVGFGTSEEFRILSKQGISFKGKIVLANAIFPFLTYPLAQEYGANGVVVLTDAPGNLCRAGSATSNRKPGQVPGVLVPLNIGQKLLTLLSTNQLKLRITLEGEFSKKSSFNIVMTIPGTTVPDEQVVLAAHYDSHNLGKHAWDNATGCATVLELARIFNTLRPKRTIKAIIFGVEEIGLCWGSFSYVDKHAEELFNIKAVHTFDGLGSPFDFKFELMATKNIRTFALNIVKELGYDVKCDAEPPPLSDHLPFQLRGIPVVWFWGGNLSVFYHTAKDDPETLDYEKLKSVADIAGEIAYKVATQKQLPFDKR